MNPRFIEYILTRGGEGLLPQNLKEPWWSLLNEQRRSLEGDEETSSADELLLAVHCLASPETVTKARAHIEETGEGHVSLLELFQIPLYTDSASQEDLALKLQCYSASLVFEDLCRKGALELHEKPTLDDIFDTDKGRSFAVTEEGAKFAESLLVH